MLPVLAQTTVRAPSNFGLRDGRGHARVFERRGGIAALMFQAQRGEARIFRGARRVVERRVAFEERDDRTRRCRRAAIRGNARRRCGRAGRCEAARACQRSRRSCDGLQELERDFDFQRAAATWADVNLFADAECRCATGYDAALHGRGAGASARFWRWRRSSLLRQRMTFRASCACPAQIPGARPAALASYPGWTPRRKYWFPKSPGQWRLYLHFRGRAR